MKHVLFIKGEEKLRYVVFDGIIKTVPRILGDKLVVKVNKFKLATKKNISYSNEAGWIAVPVKEEDKTGGLIVISDGENPEEEIGKAVNYADEHDDPIEDLLVARLLGIIGWISSGGCKTECCGNAMALFCI